MLDIHVEYKNSHETLYVLYCRFDIAVIWYLAKYGRYIPCINQTSHDVMRMTHIMHML